MYSKLVAISKFRQQLDDFQKASLPIPHFEVIGSKQDQKLCERVLTNLDTLNRVKTELMGQKAILMTDPQKYKEEAYASSTGMPVLFEASYNRSEVLSGEINQIMIGRD